MTAHSLNLQRTMPTKISHLLTIPAYLCFPQTELLLTRTFSLQQSVPGRGHTWGLAVVATGFIFVSQSDVDSPTKEAGVLARLR